MRRIRFIAVLLGCGLRRFEVAALPIASIWFGVIMGSIYEAQKPMGVAGDASEAPSSSDKLLREWEEVRSRLHESGHRFNSRYAERRYAGEDIDPQEVLQYLTMTYERTAAMAVKTITDHDSALACIQELDIYLKNMLKVSAKLLRGVHARESRNSSSALTAELRRRLLFTVGALEGRGA